jgi:hypothetical protein
MVTVTEQAIRYARGMTLLVARAVEGLLRLDMAIITAKSEKFQLHF